MRRIREIWAAQGGNTAVLFGLTIVPIIAFSGGAVDLSHRADVRAKVQSAADVAALAAARTMQAGANADDRNNGHLRQDAEANAERLFRATLADVVDPSRIQPRVKIKGNVIEVSADIGVDTSFLAVIGIKTLDAKGYAQVNIPDATDVEIALVLDYSGSMRDNDKYIRMTAAAKEFITRIGQFKSTTKIGIVPFSQYVFATLPQGYIRDTAPADARIATAACLLNRDYPYSASGETPYTNIAGSRWPQVPPTGAACQAYAARSLALHDLTTDFASLTDAMALMQPLGLTNISLATELGWQLLSPNPPYDAGANPSNPHIRKVLILLTDGVQTVPAMGPRGDVSVTAANETTAELCTNMKAAKTAVFTIAYDVDDPAAYDLLSKCASAPQNYHEVHDSSGIGAVFDDIYSQIQESVWLSR